MNLAFIWYPLCSQQMLTFHTVIYRKKSSENLVFSNVIWIYFSPEIIGQIQLEDVPLSWDGKPYFRRESWHHLATIVAQIERFAEYANFITLLENDDLQFQSDRKIAILQIIWISIFQIFLKKINQKYCFFCFFTYYWKYNEKD